MIESGGLLSSTDVRAFYVAVYRRLRPYSIPTLSRVADSIS